jgi:aspartyl-tRNA(Asn)/glutamyl-tRNA(Gln) amidotransferase subunit B
MAVELALRLGLALGSTVNPISVFARKSYSYPDLPKGYQISQYDRPLCEGGDVRFESGSVKLTRIHLEEDAGKSRHLDQGHTLIDMNRCGVPLVEIVCEPVIKSPDEAVSYLRALKQLMRYLDVCNGDMEKGEVRCDVNVSVRRHKNKMGVKTEIKNLNSFRAVGRALFFEIERQAECIARGGAVKNETLLWDEEGGRCVFMRSKEEAHDYRYFPDPDLPPLAVEIADLERIKKSIPELPLERRERFVLQYGLAGDDAGALTSAPETAGYYEDCVRAGADPKAAGDWVLTEVKRVLRDTNAGIDELQVGPGSLAGLLALIADGSISRIAGKAVFDEMASRGEDAAVVMARKGLSQIDDRGIIREAVVLTLERESAAADQYLTGKRETLEFLVGAVMKETSGKGNPHLVRELLLEVLGRLSDSREP